MIVPENLKALRKEVDEEVRRFVFETMFDIEERLLTALPQMAKAVLDSSKQATYSPTITFKKGKKETLKVTVAARVRLPDEAKEFTFRLGASGQLELALIDDEPTPEARAAAMDDEALGDLETEADEEPAFSATREPVDGDDEPPLFAQPPVQQPAPPAPLARNGQMTPAQERIAAIRANNIELARQGKLTPAQMEAAKITPEDLELQQELDEVANA
jgi:hypothetical protein